VLNTERARLDKMLANQELVSLIKGLGVGIGDQFDIKGLRYDKIVFMTDADVDGLHIATLLMTFFFRYMPEVIKAGHVYLAKPPLFGLIKGTGNTRKIDYLYDEVALEKKLNEKIEEKKKNGTKIDENQERFKQAGYTAQQRFKGLGEMDAKQLWETTMDPENRILVQVHIEDAEKADAVFTKLMGDQVDLRKNFIQAGASKVNLDDLDF
ncbi:DNA topoisomerase IV subunit B, partial [Candidatus Saccharibacteria bacterium]|nr:DNA topoisomerase IV subunit B [Candidatus Saccharibacteria bacterium]